MRPNYDQNRKVGINIDRNGNVRQNFGTNNNEVTKTNRIQCYRCRGNHFARDCRK